MRRVAAGALVGEEVGELLARRGLPLLGRCGVLAMLPGRALTALVSSAIGGGGEAWKVAGVARLVPGS